LERFRSSIPEAVITCAAPLSSPALRKLLLPALVVGCASGSARAPVLAQDADTTVARPAWTAHYLVDYSVVAGGIYLGVLKDFAPPRRSLIGPSFDPANPTAVLAPEHARALGGRFVPQRDWTMSDEMMMAAVAAHAVIIPVHEVLASRSKDQPVSLHRLHHATLAAGEAIAVTSSVVELTKALAGRLRPDFQDRVRHVYCSLPDHGGVDCTGVDPARLLATAAEAQRELDNGRRSFVSGHAATGMVLATSVALHLGSHWVWAGDATPTSRRKGVAAMAGIMLVGTAPGLTRTSLGDGVHHTGDVVAGSILGVAVAGLFHWLHFDGSGEARAGHWLARPRTRTGMLLAPDDVRVGPTPHGVGLHASWRTR
jgi:membrane-associated phospholipid phosphatase